MKWTEELIREHLLESIKILDLKRMPTAEELKSISRNDLHCKISRTKKYKGWADELGLELKRSETVLGQEWEEKIANHIRVTFKLEVKSMSTKHPYDLLIDGSVKVDVKVANPYLLRGESRVHTIRLAKSDPTCDIYVCVLLDEEGKSERVLVVPSHHVRKPMLNIGLRSKYNEYNQEWETIIKYLNFFKSI